MPTDNMEHFNIATLAHGLARMTCRALIKDAACILAADWINDKRAEDYAIIGADEVLTFQETRNATIQERTAYQRWQCTNATGISHDSLTLVDVLMWLLDHEDEEDCVTIDEVSEFIGDPMKCLA